MSKKEKSEAAEKVEKASKVKKEKKKSDKPSIFVRIPKAIARFFKDFRGETKKIIWPNAKTVLKSSGVVLAAVLVIGAGIWIVDFALSKGLDLLDSAATSYNERKASETDAASATDEIVTESGQSLEVLTDVDAAAVITTAPQAATDTTA